MLVIPWDSVEDTLKFDLGKFSRKFADMKVKKRNVVSVIVQLFDPLELLTSIFIIAKVLLHTLVKESLVDEWEK